MGRFSTGTHASEKDIPGRKIALAKGRSKQALRVLEHRESVEIQNKMFISRTCCSPCRKEKRGRTENRVPK